MVYLLDTTVLIDHVAGAFGAPALLERLFGETGEIYVCDATVTEALSAGTQEDVDEIDRLANAFEYVSTSPDAARFAARARRERGQGSTRRLGDSIIAGVAWSLGATVVTRNPRDFRALGVPVLAYGDTAA
jgi:predicted nucleic acid-binding protein